MDDKGYMVARDYEDWEEVEDIRKAAAATQKSKLSTISEAAVKS